MKERPLKVVTADEKLPLADLLADGHTSENESPDEGEGNWLVSYADMMTLLVGFFVVLQSFSKIDAGSFEKVKQETTKLFGGEYQKPYDKLAKSLKTIVREMKVADPVIFTQTDQGVEVTFRGALFFDTGAAELRPEAAALLDKLIPIIAAQAKNFGIVVEGHTDSTPLVSDGPISTNWELSSIRACRVVRLFQAKGFPVERMKALGWGDSHPVVPNYDKDGKPIADNQSQNRRVVIKILRVFED